MFHREGHRIILFSLVIVLAVNLFSHFLIKTPPLIWTIWGVSVGGFVLILQFFRNPKRHTTMHPNTVVAPVDGKVVVIEEVFEKEYFKDKRIQVSIFMSPLNVHVTRYPISGTIAYSKYHPGKYLVAWHPKASAENERTTIVMQNEKYQILYRQIAGALAKRIVNYAKVGQSATQGADCGFIKFGSRVDVFLPLGTPIQVQLGQKIRGGEAVIASLAHA